jgi:hypothetical protein
MIDAKTGGSDAPTGDTTLFDPLVRAWKAGDAETRASASLELRNLSGTPLGWSRAGQETDLIAFGDGSLHYFRRGDFGERGTKPPGLWRGACEPADLDAVWEALEGLAERDFLGRAADPGEGVTELHAHCAGFAAILAWGPGEVGKDRKGVDALAPLRRLVAKAQAETVWTLSLAAGGAARARGGVSFPLRFANGGTQPIEFLVGPAGSGADLRFEYAVDESDGDGPPLQIDWMEAEVLLPGESGLRIAAAMPGEETSVEAVIPAGLAPGLPYLGRFTYSQLGVGDRVAGRPIFAGVAFSGPFNFKGPA